MFNIYIKRVAEVYGVTQTRPIYEKAVDILPDIEAREMCLRFADLERKLGEIDRARAGVCSLLADVWSTRKFIDGFLSSKNEIRVDSVFNKDPISTNPIFIPELRKKHKRHQIYKGYE